MTSFTHEVFSELAVGLTIIAVRTGVRSNLVGIKGFQVDDYLMLAAAIIYSLETVTAYAVGAYWQGLANNGMTDAQRQASDPTSHEAYLRRMGSKTQLVGWSLYTLLLWTLKLCLAIFYSRLVSGLNHLEKRVRIAYALIGLTYVATELSILFGCHPFRKNWQIFPDPGNHCQPAISKIDLYVTVVLNVTTDMYLMTIPMPSPLYGASAAGNWAVRETFVAVTIGNLPIIYPLLSRLLDRLSPSFLLSHFSPYHRHGTSDSATAREKDWANGFRLRPTIGSERARGRGGRRGVRSLHALPTEGGSDGEEEEVGMKSGRRAGGDGDGRGVGRGKGAGITVTRETEICIEEEGGGMWEEPRSRV